jgi:hypothetical protein
MNYFNFIIVSTIIMAFIASPPCMAVGDWVVVLTGSGEYATEPCWDEDGWESPQADNGFLSFVEGYISPTFNFGPRYIYATAYAYGDSYAYVWARYGGSYNFASCSNAYAVAYSVWHWTGIPGQSPSISSNLSLNSTAWVDCSGEAYDWYGQQGTANASSYATANASSSAPGGWTEAYAWASGNAIGASHEVPGEVDAGISGDGWIDADTFTNFGNYWIRAYFDFWLDESYVSAPGAALFSAYAQVSGESVASAYASAPGEEDIDSADTDASFSCNGSAHVDISW